MTTIYQFDQFLEGIGPLGTRDTFSSPATLWRRKGLLDEKSHLDQWESNQKSLRTQFLLPSEVLYSENPARRYSCPSTFSTLQRKLQAHCQLLSVLWMISYSCSRQEAFARRSNETWPFRDEIIPYVEWGYSWRSIGKIGILQLHRVHELLRIGFAEPSQKSPNASCWIDELLCE